LLLTKSFLAEQKKKKDISCFFFNICCIQRLRRRDCRDGHGNPFCRDTKVVGTLISARIRRKKREEGKDEKR